MTRAISSTHHVNWSSFWSKSHHQTTRPTGVVGIVFQDLAIEQSMFYLGDGHAVQGAGEIVGTGIEIFTDVSFRVDVKRGWGPTWPRGENELEIFTAGNARPLDQALQHATTEMARWLEEAYGLDAIGAQTLMGMVVDYEVGNVFDPAYTMICKMPKKWLTR